ncbi:unnamed protein product [Schistosoma margrebowiei]|uniref:Uncharacterized protein n=1 Tax=Schistosoma margrebowiei TaxID=48269 RepID=A0AA85A0Q6_9TREM|nr:unnamed protein product [Schistosoma margrebowiei]
MIEISTAPIEETQIIQKPINNMNNTRNQQHQITMMDEQSLNSLPIGTNLSQEILKLVLALNTLKLPIQSLPKENKATQTEDPTNMSLISGHTGLSSRCVSISQMAASIFSSNRENSMNDSQEKNSCPFIRVVTHKNGILVHLGQLVSLSEDQKSFIMRNVISFDPFRVHERTISTLEPAEILALTESKLQSQYGKRGNLLSDYLHNQMMFNASVNSSCENSKQVNISEQKHEAVHGPLLITPSDVLIRLSEVRELSIVPVIRFDHPKQMRQVGLKHGSQRIIEVKKYGPSQDIVNTSKLSESTNKRPDTSIQCNEYTDIANSSKSLDPCEDTGQLSEVTTNGFSKQKEIDQKCVKKSLLRKAKNKVKELVESLEEGGERSNSSMKHLKFSESKSITQANCNNSTDCNNSQSFQQNLQKQVPVQQKGKNGAKPPSVHKTRRRSTSAEGRRRRERRLLNKKRYSEGGGKTRSKSVNISSSSFLKCSTSTPHLINGRSEASSRWYDNGIVSITIQQSSTNSTMNHSNSLLKLRQKTPVKNRSLK